MTLDVEPIPVTLIDGSPAVLAPEFGNTSFWQVPQIGTAQPSQILQQRPTRTKAVISVQNLGGTGSQVTLPQTPPAAGAPFVYTNTTGAPQQLLSATGLLTTDATVANRFQRIVIADSTGHQISTATDSTAQVASTTLTLNAFQGATQQNSASGTWTAPLPIGVVVPVGGTVTLTGQSGVGDQWSAINLTLVTGSVASGVILASRSDYLANSNNPQGYLISNVPHVVQWENAQPLYAIALGGGPVTVSVLDQATYAANAHLEEYEMSVSLDDQEEGEQNYGDSDRSANTY